TPNGVPLHWLDDEVSLVLDPDVPESVAEDLAQTFEQAIKPWNDLSCVSTSLVIEGVESCPGEIVDDGVNCVVWVDKPELWRWPSHLVGITLVHFEGDTGRIIDTDMEFNGAFTTWSTGTECTDEHHDLWATVTHEVGHLLGLDHSNRPQATMNAVTFPGDCKKRTLHEDDEETVCGLYAGIPYVTDGGSSATDGGNSGSGDASSTGGGDSGGEGNSVGCGATPGDSGPLWAMVIGAGWLASHRRRRRPSPYRAR
ncbi:MAG: matrixin family metalloprotease, partial [Myxococcota bacterium]|nr:matrixin family metalloprotease [Myxococcota bacterium]